MKLKITPTDNNGHASVPFHQLILLTAKVISISLSLPQLPLYGRVGLMLINLEGVGLWLWYLALKKTLGQQDDIV